RAMRLPMPARRRTTPRRRATDRGAGEQRLWQLTWLWIPRPAGQGRGRMRVVGADTHSHLESREAWTSRGSRVTGRGSPQFPQPLCYSEIFSDHQTADTAGVPQGRAEDGVDDRDRDRRITDLRYGRRIAAPRG